MASCHAELPFLLSSQTACLLSLGIPKPYLNLGAVLWDLSLAWFELYLSLGNMREALPTFKFQEGILAGIYCVSDGIVSGNYGEGLASDP